MGEAAGKDLYERDFYAWTQDQAARLRALLIRLRRDTRGNVVIITALALPVLLGSGGSIPIAAWARDILGIDTLLMGFSLEDDGMHSPNEKFEVTCFHRGMRAHAALLEQLR